MARSTAGFVSYDLRPAKQSERRILIDVLKVGGDIGLPIIDYRYVGMGANRFYDFLMIHKYTGISEMISLEHDAVMHARAVFNVPYSFINVQPKSVADFIGEDESDKPTIYWLDYDGGIGGPIVRDIAALGMKLKVGDYCFVTAFGHPSSILDKLNSRERLGWLEEFLGDVSRSITLEDLSKSNFPFAVWKILLASFQNAVAPRRDGGFVPLLQVSYTDSKPMVTVGGAFLSPGQATSYRAGIARSLPFLSPMQNKLYDIASFNITERERHLFDRVSTSPTRRHPDRKKLLSLGFNDDDIKTYKELVRYIPRYVETML